MSQNTVNRVTIEYRHPTILVNDEALGFTDLLLDLHTGRPPRGPKKGDDLFTIRAELVNLGFHQHDTESFSLGHGQRQRRHLEHWQLVPPPPEPANPTIMRTTVRYHRKGKVYQVLAENGIDALANCATREDAEWTELLLFSSQIHSLAWGLHEKFPELGARALKAGQIVARGMIQPNGKPHLYHVESDGKSGRVYQVYVPPDKPAEWTCTIGHDPHDPSAVDHICPDIEGGTAPLMKHGPRCKHMTAAFILSRLGQPPAIAEAGSGPKQAEAPAVPSAEASHAPKEQTTDDDSTTLPDIPQVPAKPRVVATYADGRAAKLSDGTIVRYTAGGQPIFLPA